eukprot:SAG22_NODE_722_length_7641_cov_13.307876_5_plen_44_part_00
MRMQELQAWLVLALKTFGGNDHLARHIRELLRIENKHNHDLAL